MTQYVINIGAVPNDGTGDPLRTAFNETNLNFDQVFTAGPVLSNIQIANNKILTTNTNGNLILAPNGTGVVQSNVSIVPNLANLRNLGSSTQRWATVYTQYLNVSAGTSVNGDLSVAGNLTVQGNIIQVGNIVTETLTIQLANAATTPSAANGSGITVGATDDIATILYNSTSNVWTTNIGVSSVGNISAPYFVGNGSQLTGLAATYGNANVVTLLAGFGSNTVSTSGNITGGFIFGNISQANGFPTTYGNANVTTLLSNLGSNVISGTGNITTTANISGGFILGNLAFANGLPATYGNANVVANLAALGSNPISTTGNISGNYFLGNGSQLTGLSTSSISNGTSNVSIATANGNPTVTSAGNTWTFGGPQPDALYWPDGSFQATAFVGQALDLVNTGNASITSNSTGNTTYVWTFGDDGRLTFPGTPVIDTDANNFDVLGAENISLEANAVVNIYTDTSGNAYQWQFGDNGATIFPTLSVTRGDRTGTLTGQTLLFGDDTQEAIISTPDGNANVISDSQRLVINPGKGADGTTGEGGDIYLYAGRGGDAGGSGGDIKIRGGLGPVDGAGGYIRMDGGESQGNGAPGFIEITGGQGGTTTGGYVQITGGVGGSGTGGAVDIIGGFGNQGPGANVSITGGGSANGLASYGNVNIAAGASTWSFKNNGTTQFPGNVIQAPEGRPITVKATNGNASTRFEAGADYAQIGLQDDTTGAYQAWAYLETDMANVNTPSAVVILKPGDTGTEVRWTYDALGNLTLPTNGDINFAAGGITQTLNEDLYIRASDDENDGWSIYNVVDDGAGNTLTQTRLEYNQFSVKTDAQGAFPYTWQFRDSGLLEIPGDIAGNVGGNLTIKIGDQAGSDTFIDLQTRSYTGDALISNIHIGNPNIIVSTASAAYNWTFDNTGNLTVPGNSIISTTNAIGGLAGNSISITAGAAGQGTFNTNPGGNLNLVGGVGGFNDDGSGGPGGNVNITAGAPGEAGGAAGNVTVNAGTNTWTFDNTGDLTLPTINLGGGNDEQTVIQSQRRLVPPFRYSAEITGTAPTVVYTATNVNTTSMKVTMQIQHTGLGFEFFEVFATYTGSVDTWYTVSNRVAPPTIDASTVVVDLNGSNTMQITVTINSGAATSWVTYDAVEFGIPVD